MDRADWIAEKRRVSRQRFDMEWAPIYDENWGEIWPEHREFLTRFLAACPPNSLILDAACGTGKYWPMTLDAGHRVFGADQSEGMLKRARQKFADVPTAQIGLQEMAYHEEFDAAICMDAMENVFPEDWPLVITNLYRAIRPGGYLYFTVETIGEQELADVFDEVQRLGAPVVYGEYAPEGGYHYYPSTDQVKEWAAGAGFRPVDDMAGQDYHHFLVQKPA